MSDRAGAWRVRRTGGLLVPGFTKRFDEGPRAGVTYLWGIPIGRFDVRVSEAGGCELHYRRWPIVDALDAVPARGGSIRAAGFVRVPGGRRVRFCRFRLER